MSGFQDRNWTAEDSKRRVISEYGVWQETCGNTISDWQERINVDRMRIERRERVRDELKKRDLAAIMCFRDFNMRYIAASIHFPYLTEHQQLGPLPAANRYVILAQDVEKASYYEHGSISRQIAHHCPWLHADYARRAPFFELVIGHEANEAVKKTFVEFIKGELKRMGVLKERLAVDIYAPQLEECLGDVGIEVTTEGIEVMAAAREIKTQDEVECIRMASAIGEAALWAVGQAIAPGVRESDLVGVMNQAAYKCGGTSHGDAFVVASGPNTDPNTRTFTERMIRPGDVVFADAYGVRFLEYHTCYYRTFVCGKAWPELKEAYKKAAYWMRAPLEGIKAGSSTREIAERFPTAKDFGVEDEDAVSGNAIAHGIGLSHIEPPMIGRAWALDHPMILKENHVFAIEVQFPDGLGQGVRFEDVMRITKTGYELLTRWPIDEIIECPLR